MLKENLQWLEKHSKKIVLLFFVLLFIYGCIAGNDYGINTDESLQRRHSLATYIHLFMKDKDYHTATFDSDEVKKYGMTAYGSSLQLPLVFIEHLNDFEMTYQEIYTMRHYYNFFWFFLSVIFFYRLAMILTEGKRLEALLGTVIYVICPRTLADSFYNIKDGLCMALFTISIFYGVRLIRKLSWRDIFPFVIFSAFCTVSRIVGGVVVAVVIFIVFLKLMLEKKWKILLGYCTLVCGLFVGMFVVISPNVWNDIPAMLMRIIQIFSNYTLWDSYMIYMGEWVAGTNLPWHYLFVWIGMTVPATYLIFMAAGLRSGCAYCIRNRKNLSEYENRGWIYLALLLILVVPFLYVLIVRPVLYDGWRHFYFMYPVIVCWAIIGLHDILGSGIKQEIKYAVTAALAGVFVYLAIWIGKNHPYEYVYYNPWIRSYAADHFPRDYWYVSEKDCLKYILDHDERETINVFCERDFTWFFNGERNPLHLVGSPEFADYVVTGGDDFQDSYLFEKAMDITVDNMAIHSVYRRALDIVKSVTLTIGATESKYELNGIRWTQERADGKRIYVGELTEPIGTDILAVILSNEELLDKITVCVSDDAKHWYPLEASPQYSACDLRISAECVVYEMKYVKVICPENITQETQIRLVMSQYGETVSRQGVNLTIENLESNVETANPLSAMTDGNIGTRWETPFQEPGMYVEVTLDDEYSLCGVTLETGESPWDYPRELKIFGSLDGEEWTEIAYSTTDHDEYTFEPFECRYLRLEVGAAERTDWSIYELSLFTMVE